MASGSLLRRPPESDEQLVRRLRGHSRFLGVMLLFSGVCLTTIMVFLAQWGAPQSSRFLILACLGIVLIPAGAWSIVRAPAYLRHPEQIDRIERHSQLPDHVSLFMQDGAHHHLPVAAFELERVKAAFERLRDAARARSELASATTR